MAEKCLGCHFALFRNRPLLALPKELSDKEQIDLTRRYVNDRFVSKGVAAEIAIHKAHSPDGINDHAHVLITTRRIEGDQFSGQKARDLNPDFSRGQAAGFIRNGDQWPDDWANYQNAYFVENSIKREDGSTLTVDPYGIVPQIHQGKDATHAKGTDGEQSRVEAQNTKRQEEAREKIKQPEILLGAVTRNNSYFTRRDVERTLSKHKIYGAEREAITEETLSRANVLSLYDKDGARTAYYTIKEVRDQEQRVMRNAEAVAQHTGFGLSDKQRDAKIAQFTLEPEQQRVFKAATENNGLHIVQGDAGTGKSHTMGAIRSAYEDNRYDVRGLAPTNNVVADMRKDGFSHANTLHMELILVENGKEKWSNKTVLMVDEAAMKDTEISDRLMSQANKSGAKVVMFGDDKQLDSVQRGGMYSEIRAVHGNTQLTDVRRQESEWQRDASKELARGEMQHALQRYDEKGAIRFHETTNDARATLVRQYMVDSTADPNKDRFVYASTNKNVNAINHEIQAHRAALGAVRNVERFNTVRGKINAGEGDRIQMYETHRKDGIFNGTLGTIEKSSKDHITARMDDGSRVSFNPNEKQGWGLGYAGTVHRGQGKTQMDVYAFYDNSRMFDQRLSYVAMTRQKESMRLYVGRDIANNVDQLASQMARQRDSGASLKYDVGAEKTMHPRTAAKQDRVHAGAVKHSLAQTEKQRIRTKRANMPEQQKTAQKRGASQYDRVARLKIKAHQARKQAQPPKQKQPQAKQRTRVQAPKMRR